MFRINTKVCKLPKTAKGQEEEEEGAMLKINVIPKRRMRQERGSEERKRCPPFSLLEYN